MRDVPDRHDLARLLVGKAPARPYIGVWIGENDKSVGFARMHPLWVRFGNVSVQRPMLALALILANAPGV